MSKPEHNLLLTNEAASNDDDPRDMQIRKLEAELEHFTKSGIIEIAVRNPSVNEYMHHWERRATTAEADIAELVEGIIDVAASLVAAVSLLERGGKKAAPSNKMFDQMIVDYKNSIERARTLIAKHKAVKP